MYSVPQGLRCGPLLFNISLTDFLLECEDDSNTDNTTPYSCTENMFSVITKIQRIADMETNM